MAVAFVKSTAGNNGAGSTTVVVTTTSTAGNALVVSVHTSNVAVSSVTDSAGNVYTKQSSGANGNVVRAEIWTSPVSASAVTSVTVTLASSTVAVANVGEYSGVVAYGNNGGQTNGSTNAPSITIPIQVANNWVVGAYTTSGTGTFTGVESSAVNGSIGGALDDNTAASIGLVTVSATLSATETYTSTAVELSGSTLPTKLYLLDATSTVTVSDESHVLDITRGSASVNYVKNTVAGTVTPPTTATQFTKVAAGANIIWISPQLATSATISGTVSFHIRAFESAAAANATVTGELVRLSSTGSVLSVIAACVLARTEIGTADARQFWTVTPTSTSLSAGDRLGVRLYIDDGSGVTMASGNTVTVSVNGPTGGAAGDSYVNLSELLPIGVIAVSQTSVSAYEGTSTLTVTKSQPHMALTSALCTLTSNDEGNTGVTGTKIKTYAALTSALRTAVTNNEILTALSVANVQPYMALSSLLRTLLSNDEIVASMSRSLSGAYEVLTGVSGVRTSSYLSLNAVVGSATNPYESLSAIVRALLSNTESITSTGGPLTAVWIGNYESLRQVSPVSSSYGSDPYGTTGYGMAGRKSNYGVQAGTSSSLGKNYEWLRTVISGRAYGYDAYGKAGYGSPPYVSNYDTLVSLSTSMRSNYEIAQTFMSRALSAVYEAQRGLSPSSASSQESLTRFVQTLDSSYENLVPLAKALLSNDEYTVSAAKSAIDTYEALGRPSPNRVSNYNALTKLAVTRAGSHEWLFKIAPSSRTNVYEALRGVLSDIGYGTDPYGTVEYSSNRAHRFNVEAAGRIANQLDSLYEQLQTVQSSQDFGWSAIYINATLAFLVKSLEIANAILIDDLEISNSIAVTDLSVSPAIQVTDIAVENAVAVVDVSIQNAIVVQDLQIENAITVTDLTIQPE